MNSSQSDKEFIKVMTRLRPVDGNVDSNSVVTTEGRHIIRFGKKGMDDKARYFDFDRAFDGNTKQDEIFNELAKPIVESCLEGINGTIFAYGQTGSGKTHTMLGPSGVDMFSDPVNKGLIPRIAEYLFTKLERRMSERSNSFGYTVKCQFVEIYNEKVFDLLESTLPEVTLRSTRDFVHLQGSTEEGAKNYVDMMQIVRTGWNSRRVGETAMNHASSRSHAVFIVDVSTEEVIDDVVNKKKSRLNLVDLAGSERQKQAQSVGDRFKEATHINQSLSVLGRVIRLLSSKSNSTGNVIVPYRESMITHLLRDSLGGNSRTTVICTLHTDTQYHSDTLSTLQFAEATRSIKNHVIVNENISCSSELAYKAEITKLRRQVENVRKEVLAEEELKRSKLMDERNTLWQLGLEKQKRIDELLIKNEYSAMRCTPEQMEKNILDEWKRLLLERLNRASTTEQFKKLHYESIIEQLQFERDEALISKKESESMYRELSEKYTMTLEDIQKDETKVDAMCFSEISMMTPKQRKARRTTIFSSARPQQSVQRKILEFDGNDENMPPSVVPGQDQGSSVEAELLNKVIEVNRLKQSITDLESRMEERQSLEQKKAADYALLLGEKDDRITIEMENVKKLTEVVEEQKVLLGNERARAEGYLSQLNTAVEKLQASRNSEAEINTTNTELKCLIQELKNELDAKQAFQEEFEETIRKNIESEFVHKQYTDTQEAIRIREQFELERNDYRKTIDSLEQGKKVMEELILSSSRQVAKHKQDLANKEDEITELQQKYQFLQAKVTEHSDTVKRKSVELENANALNAKLSEELMQWEERYQESQDRINMMELSRDESMRNQQETQSHNNSLRRSLETAQESLRLEQIVHEETKIDACQQQKQANLPRRKLQETSDAFQRKVEELRSTFGNKESKLQAEASEIVVKNENLSSQLKQMSLEYTALQDELKNEKQRANVLQNHVNATEGEIQHLAGHQNKHQKIQYVSKLSTENAELKLKVAELESQVKSVASRTRSSAAKTKLPK